MRMHRMTFEKTVLCGTITWSEMGIQNIKLKMSIVAAPVYAKIIRYASPFEYTVPTPPLCTEYMVFSFPISQ